MRKLAVLLALALGIAVLAPPVMDAAAKTNIVKLSKDQVSTVCGKNLHQTGGGHTGCAVSCGNGKQVCEFDCDKTGKQCGGQCVTCRQSKFPWGKRYPVHVVKKEVRLAR
jgi:hypothetical protein